MQRNYRFLWLALIPLGAAGALATGIVPMPWQSTDEQPQATAKSPPPTEARQQAAVRPEPKKPSATSSANSAEAGAGKLRPFGVDVARISSVGSSVIAGYGTPGSPMNVMADGKSIGVVTPDAKGDWVLVTPYKFAHLDPKISLSIADQTGKTVAALDSAAKTPKPAATEPTRSSTGAPKRRAAEVTKQMLQRLKQLTAEAQAGAEPAVSNASKSPQQVASFRPSSNAPSTQKVVATGSVPAKPATTPSQIGQAPVTAPPESAASGPTEATSVRTPTAPPVAAASPVTVSPSVTPRQIATAAPPASQTLNSKTASGQSPPYLPVPVQFVYRRADFTEQGREAAALLLEYFKAKDFQAVVLSGHADERGSTGANKALSQQRLLRIREVLRAGGFKGRLKLVPKGETEKYLGVDRSQFEAEELYQLDRRVEVMSAR